MSFFCTNSPVTTTVSIEKNLHRRIAPKKWQLFRKLFYEIIDIELVYLNFLNYNRRRHSDVESFCKYRGWKVCPGGRRRMGEENSQNQRLQGPPGSWGSLSWWQRCRLATVHQREQNSGHQSGNPWLFFVLHRLRQWQGGMQNCFFVAIGGYITFRELLKIW